MRLTLFALVLVLAFGTIKGDEKDDMGGKDEDLTAEEVCELADVGVKSYLEMHKKKCSEKSEKPVVYCMGKSMHIVKNSRPDKDLIHKRFYLGLGLGQHPEKNRNKLLDLMEKNCFPVIKTAEGTATAQDSDKEIQNILDCLSKDAFKDCVAELSKA